MLTLRQMQCVAALADTLHFRRAAEQVGVTQPALSAQIAQLEDHLGVLLFERSRRTVLATPVGREVAERARGILRDVGDLEDAARRASEPLSGTLRIGVLRTLGPYLLPHFLPVLRVRHPRLKLYLREEPGQRLVSELRQGELDLLLVATPPADDDLLTDVPLFVEPLWAALPLDNPLVAKDALVPEDMRGEQLILLEFGDGMRDPALGLCQSSGAAEHPDFRATSLDSLRQMVATGLGASLLPALYVEAEALADDQIAVRPFVSGAPSRSIHLIWRRTTSRSDEFRLLSRLILDNLPGSVSRIG